MADLSREQERWLPVPGREGLYEVSDQGRVRSMDRIITCRNGVKQHYPGKTLTPTLAVTGYYHIDLGRDGVRWLVHRLVLTAFVGVAPPGAECCHNDGNRANNRLENLRWDTHTANMYDKQRHGTDHQVVKTACPRGHLLTPPNLKASLARMGRRACLACDRAKATERYHLSQGHVFDFDAVVAQKYAEIMGVGINDGNAGEGRVA